MAATESLKAVLPYWNMMMERRRSYTKISIKSQKNTGQKAAEEQEKQIRKDYGIGTEMDMQRRNDISSI